MNIESILANVEKPGRYTGGEWNEKRKDPRAVKAKVALIFPDVYEIGMSYLGQKILYSLLNAHPLILAERVYAPWVDLEKELRSQKKPLFSLENKIPLGEFDLLGFSLLYELNYSNILTILDLANVPFLASERDMRFPLVIGGGPAVFNPEPIAPLFDLFLVGDGEEAFLEIVERYIRVKKECDEKGEILRELGKIKGVYLPGFYTAYKPRGSALLAVRPIEGAPHQINKRIFFDFNTFPSPEKIIVPNVQIIFDRVAVEVARGCPQRCRFCQASSIYSPYRVKNPSLAIESVLNSLETTGYEDVSLTALSISDYPYLDAVVESLMENLSAQKVSLSLSSLRPHGLSSGVVENILKVRKTGFTLVPEAGTDRLRRVINKNLNEDKVIEASSNAFSHGWRLLKLYFMVGLPTERDEDLEGIIRLVKEIIKVGSGLLSSPPKINLSIASFIPKPHTPFQWLKMEDERILREKHHYLRSRLKQYRFIRFKEHPIKGSLLECIFSRGDRQLTNPLIKAWNLGVRFDSWKDKLSFHLWEEAFKSEEIDYSPYLESLSKEAVLPWDHIECGMKKAYLLQELERALRGESTASCIETECAECQGCSLWPQVEKEFREEINVSANFSRPLGKKTGEVLRYRVFYSKTHQARYISHLDLIAVIRRALRRACVSVLYSRGFHPKMLTSFLPALPLGMEGRAEVLEFKSMYIFPEREFIQRVNECLPTGINFFHLKKIEPSEQGLSQSLEDMVYSLDLKSPEVRKAVGELRKKKTIVTHDNLAFVQGLINDYLDKNSNPSLKALYADMKEEKLILTIHFSPQKGLRAQKIIEEIFGIEHPAFLMAREEVSFKEPGSN